MLKKQVAVCECVHMCMYMSVYIYVCVFTCACVYVYVCLGEQGVERRGCSTVKFKVIEKKEN